MKFRLAFVLSIACTAHAQQPAIEAARISAHVKILASDEFEGRGPGTPGETKAVNYIVGQLKQMGLQPGNGNSFTQDVPLAQSDIIGPVSVTVKAGGTTKSLKQGDDIAVRATHLPVNKVAIENAPLVFVGYGVHAPERQWDDFKGVDLHGKVAVVLINDPDFEADLGGKFGGKAMTYYGRWTYKYEEAARQGALGMIVVHETEPASYGWATVKNSNTATMIDIRRPKPADFHPLLEAWMQRDVTVDLFKAAGLNFDAEKKKAQSADFKPVTLKNASISVNFAVKQSEIVSKNIVAMVKGTTHPDETVMYSAHWDHLGVGLPDAKGDRIYNGAHDNALGVAGILEVARMFASQPASQRSVVFLFVTAEEKGLLGSEYYANHPVFPLATTAAVYNLDGGSTDGKSWDVTVRGDGKISLQDDLAAAAVKTGRHLSPDVRPEAGSFYRSDHFSFAKAGVPAISFQPGEDLVDGGPAGGKAANADYNINRYHQPADEWSDTWDLRGMVQDMTLLYTMGREMANSRTWPHWEAGSEFKAIRESTNSSRK